MVVANGSGTVESAHGLSLTAWLESLKNFGGWDPTGIGQSHRLPWLMHYALGVPDRLAYPNQSLDWLLVQAAERFPTRGSKPFAIATRHT